MKFQSAAKILKAHKKDLSSQGVKSLAIFGSVARNESIKTSDIDILIEFDPKKGLFGFVGLKEYLEEILDCRCDLVSKRALHPALKSQILQEARHVF